MQKPSDPILKPVGGATRTKLVLLLAWWCLNLGSAHAIIFTNDAIIAEGNTIYDGHDVVVDGAVATIDGPHSFNSLLLTNGAVLTHSPCTETETHKLDVTVTNAFVVSSDSRIDVSGKGYIGGYTTGNTTNGAATTPINMAGGGSYGGLGGGSANRVYGDYADPQDWGSGGANWPGVSAGQPGGGLVRIRAQLMHLNGQVLAVGRGGCCGGGSGSGGSILLSVGTLEGGGIVSAAGGETSNGSGYSGGGGRVAIYAGDFSNFIVLNITARGGDAFASAGTIYLRDTNSTSGTVIIDNGASFVGSWTPLGLPGTNLLAIPDDVAIRSAGTLVRPEHPGLMLIFQNTLTVTNGARLELADLRLNGATPLVLGSNSLIQLSGSLISTAPTTIDGGTLIADRLVASELTLTNGAALTCQTSTTNEMHRLEVDVAGTITISPTSRIHSHDNGYRAGYTTGNTRNGAAAFGSGASHGGLGAGPAPNALYGDYADPEDWGSGGEFNTLAHGGGLVRVRASSVVLNGELGAGGNFGFNGGGSGGSVLVEAERLLGAGTILAPGGGTGGVGPGGGGGRVAVYASDLSGFSTNNIDVVGGVVGGAEPGTVFISTQLRHTHARFTIPGKLSAFPSNNYTLPVRALTDGLTVHFNKTIDTNSFTPAKLSLRGPLGVIVPTGLSEVGDRSYAFAFPPQTENGPYHFALSPALLDTEGFMLDQNANGIPGEPEDTFSFTLILDTVPPRITQHDPAGDIAGTITNVDIWFSEAIDATTFTTADISIRNPTNGVVGVSSLTNVGLNRFRVSFPAQTMAGQYHILIATNITDPAGNFLEALYDATFNLVPVDLELANVTPSTNQFFAGDPVVVSWQGRNNSGAPLLGDWIDAVYLSPDPFWNITDILLGTVQHTGGLASNEVYSASLNFSVPGLLPGNYYLIVRADVGNQARETVETNNIIAFGPIPISFRQLSVGDSLGGTLTLDNRYQYFAINIPTGESLRLALNGGAGVNHLFVSYAAIPTRLNADTSGTSAGSNQSVLITGGSGGGIYYVLVSGEQIAGGGNTYTLTAEASALFLDSITPSAVAGGETQRFWVPILESNQPAATIMGAGFDQQTAVQFVLAGVAFSPARVDLLSPTALNVFLPINSWPVGVYDLRLTKGAASRTLPMAFTITNGGAGNLEATIVGTSLSPGGGQTLYVEYRNTGTRAIPTPLLKVTAYTNCTITTHSLNWKGVPGAAPPRFSSVSVTGGGGGGGPSAESIPTYIFNVGIPLHTVQAMAVGSSTTPGWLQPGERGRIPVHFQGLQQDHFESSIQFSVGSVTADDTTIVEWPPASPGVPPAFHFPRHGYRLPLFYWTNGVERLFTVNWTELETNSRPETVDAAGWNAVWSNLLSNTGPLWPDYVLMLGDNMNHLAKVGQLTNDPAALFNFEVLQATATVNPVRTLAAAVDASAPSPGFPLVFRRTFGQPILSRFKLGPLGRGWTHNWDISVQGLEKFYGVVVHGPNGADRLFGRFNDGSYAGLGGDTGQLIVTNNLFRLVESDGTVWQFGSHNLRSLLDYVEDPDGNRITCGYSGAQLTSLTHTSGKQLLLQYNGSGRLSQVTDSVGRVTTYEYDAAAEHLIRVAAPGNRVTTYTYDSSGVPQRTHALVNIVHPDLTQDSFAYDAQGRLIQTSQNCCGGAQQVTYAYDSAGTVTVTDATGRATQLLYGLGGQLAQVRDGEGRIVNFTYDDLAQLTQLLGPGGERYRYGYDGGGNLSGIEDPLRQVNNFTYEPSFNRLAQVRDARGNALQYAYDTRGNLTAITYADNTRELFAYNTNGNVIASTNRRGGVITYAYNLAGQLTSKDYAATPGITDFTYAYDLAGNLTNATYWNPQLATQETLNLQYDPFTDHLTRIEYPGGRYFAFEYDAAGRRTRRADQDGHVTAYLYDALGRLARMTNELGQTIVIYDYDPAGRLSRKTLGNGVFTTYTYNQAGQVTQLVNSRADSNVLSSFAYTYDASGRRASMTTLAGTETYGYDPLGQLTSVTYPNSRVVNYAYDAAGNRTQVTDNGVPATYAANTLNQYTSAGAATFGYDLDGNLTNRSEGGTNTVYTYDSENRLIGVATPADTWTYSYDAFGNRIAAAHNGQTTRYVIDPTGLGNVAAEYGGGGSLVARYEHGFGLLARQDGANDPAYYTFSAIGHTSELTDSVGNVANSYAFDPFGLSLAKNETIPNPFEFVGEFGVMNEGNGLEFMRARYYLSPVGRFIAVDPTQIRGGLNPYAGMNNNPVSLVDPRGLQPIGVRPPPSIIITFPRDDWEIIQGYYKYCDEHPLDPICVFGTIGSPPDAGGDDNGPDTSIPKPRKSPTSPNPPANDPTYDVNDGEPTPHIPPPVDPPDPNPVGDLLSWFLQLFRYHDPNDKLGPAGYSSVVYVPANGVFPYEIRFENESIATAPAQNVVVTDALDANLDLNTFELLQINFANQVIPIPASLNHYETRLYFLVTNQTLIPQTEMAFLTSTATNSLLIVDVNAALDRPTRTFTLALNALDPNTGWLPADPLLGFLFPDDDTGRGQGSVSYLVRANTNVTTGTVITNRARIVFGYNDPIDTPVVSNTIDANPPTSAVAALPAEAGPRFLVHWNGADEVNGSGLASYDIYVSVNGTNRFLWMVNTTETSAWFQGERGSTYTFYAVARDNVANVEAPPAVPDAVVTVPATAPLLAGISAQTAAVGDALFVTNFVSGVPTGSFQFSLDPTSPAGAWINPTNGVLRWTPNCAQASRTNTVTVWVTDSGNTNLQASTTFTVAVGECVMPGLGGQILLAGDSGRVPVYLISSVPLASLGMTLDAPTNRITVHGIENVAPELCTNSIVPLSNSVYWLAFGACTNEWLMGTQQLAWLNFSTVASQSSAFVTLQLDDMVGLGSNGIPAHNFSSQQGRLVIIAEEPLLEAGFSTDGQPLLTFYGKPGTNYVIEYSTTLESPMSWQFLAPISLTNLFHQFHPVIDTNGATFFRGRMDR